MNTVPQEDINYQINKVKTIINNSNNEKERIKNTHLLKDLGIVSPDIFRFVENLLISDSNPHIRNLAAIIIKNDFIDNALQPSKAFGALCWAYNHEKSIECLLNIVTILGELESLFSKKYLLERLTTIEVEEIRNYIGKLKNTEQVKNISNKKLANHLKHYHIIKHFIDNFELVRYRIENGYVIELDFSFAYNNEFTPSIIEKLPNIIADLKELRSLNLKFNKLKEVPKFIKRLPYLESLNLSNNQIKTLPEYISEFSSLEYLDLSWNNIQRLPKDIHHLQNIRRIDLKNNKNITPSDSLVRLRERGTRVYI